LKAHAQLKEQGIEVDRKKIMLEEPIKSLGMFPVPIKLHADIVAQLKVWVVFGDRVKLGDGRAQLLELIERIRRCEEAIRRLRRNLRRRIPHRRNLRHRNRHPRRMG
jgi:hypothetical protein